MNKLKFLMILLLCCTIGYLFFFNTNIPKPDPFNFPVDLVYTWVDGNDPIWQKKKNLYLKGQSNVSQDSAGEHRYADHDELKYSLRSVEKNIPWVRHIYIITDSQKPIWLKDHPKVTIIDHKNIFPPDALPTFNSTAIETRLPFIPGLSEHFLFANDDYFVNFPLEKSFFFDQKGNPIADIFILGLTPQNNLYGDLIQHTNDVVATKYRLPFNGKGLELGHNITPYRKSYYIENMKEFEKEFHDTTYSKFRSKNEMQRVGITLIDALKHRTLLRFNKMTPQDSPCKYNVLVIDNPFFLIEMYHPCLFCINEPANRPDFGERLRRFLEMKFPEKSSFEK